ncbi:hypothetical protein niasHS_011289 [Heterodera schachtii]|uniref:Uncharacterized protein n=1 Tax=Heterodera schachtii TaxID=97005 RepID=A0ABD2IWH6_HETSC
MKTIFISIFLIVFSSTTNNVRGVLIGDDIGRNINNGGETQIIKAVNVKEGAVISDEEEANTSDDEMDEAWGRNDGKGNGFGKITFKSFSERFNRNDSDNEDTEGNSSNDSEIEKGAKAKDVRHNSKNKGISESTRGSGDFGHWKGWEDFERKFDHKDSDGEGNESNSSNDSGIEKEAKEMDDKNSGGGDVQEKTGQPTRNYWKYLKKVPVPFLNTFRNSFKGNSEQHVAGEERPSRENVLVPNINTGGGNQHIAPVTFGDGSKGNQVGGNYCAGGGQNIAPVTLGAGLNLARVGNNKNSGGKQTVGAVTIRRS